MKDTSKKIVDFEHYCPLCKWYNVEDGIAEKRVNEWLTLHELAKAEKDSKPTAKVDIYPCDECLNCGGRTYSHKPIKFEQKQTKISK